jgi:ribosome-associated protein
MQSLELARRIASLADERKAQDPLVLDLRELTIVTDYFVLLTGTSRPHVLGIADYIKEELGKCGVHPQQREVDQGAQWLLLDYGSVVVHIFQQQTRLFYSLDRLWNDAKRVPLDDLLQ